MPHIIIKQAPVTGGLFCERISGRIMEKGLTGNKLKLIAILSMTLDHVISVLFPNYPTEW